MNHKVLLADDSLTIQKVIKITLANQPYDITESFNEEELFQKLPGLNPKIVFLDFNLSEKYTGYELTAKIKSICPGTKVLLLLGTFDTVDDAALAKCGASDKIVKPFDSNKFIAICKQLVQSSGEAEPVAAPAAAPIAKPVVAPIAKPVAAPIAKPVFVPEPESEPSITMPSDADLELPGVIGSQEENPEDQWKMTSAAAQSFDEVEEVHEPEQEPLAPQKMDALAKVISDWGMSVPNVINETEPQEIRFDLPPVIGEVKSLDEYRPKVEESKPVKDKRFDIKFPETDDLDYPTIEELENKSTAAVAAPTPTPEVKKRPPAQLISIETFNEKPFELEGNYVEDVADVSSIEAQIKDEVEANLWHADEFEDLKREVSSKIEEMKKEFTPSKNDFDESLFKPLDEGETTPLYHFDSPVHDEPMFAAAQASADSSAPKMDVREMRAEMEGMVKKYVQEYMDEMFQKNVEKITWEVIPDLAENLIRQELGKIANKIINDPN